MQSTPLTGIHQRASINPKHNKDREQLPRSLKKFFPPTELNINKLKKWILEHFAKTAFKDNGEFPPMSGPTTHIHLKEGAVPKARHNSTPMPFHFKELVKQAFGKVKRGIITPEPVGMPTDWCTVCSKIAQSQPKEPVNLTPSPAWPLQIVMDFLETMDS